MRGLVLRVGRGLYRTQRGKEPGQYPGLWELLPVLGDAGLDPSWKRFLSTFFANPAGANYRNELSHGFLGEIGPDEAATVLVGAVFLAVDGALKPMQRASIEAAQAGPPAEGL
jgi:hypothetical protein